jgi:RecA/RadA recombinase
VDPSNFDDVVAAINKKYAGELRQGNDYEHPQRISYRSLALDIASGGGCPMGRVSRYYGPFSSTKTLTALNVIAEAMEMGYSCCYWNVEKQYDPFFAETYIGIDTSQLLVMEGTTIEDIGEKLESLLGVVHLHVIDSCSQAVSQDELNAGVNEWRPGLAARAWGKVFRRINERFDHVENTIILLDQVRDNFRTKSEEPPGGRMLDFISSMSMKYKKGSWLFRDTQGFLNTKEKAGVAKDVMSDQLRPAGIEINARVEKSRVCRPLVPAAMRFDLDALKFDRTFEYMEAAKGYGIVDKRGGGNYYDPANPKKGQSQERLYGESKLRTFIADNYDVQREIRQQALKIATQR